MSNYRISASMKDDIRKAYRRKINAIDEKIKDKSRVLVGTLLEDLNNNPKTEEFKEMAKKIYSWIEEVDPEHDFVDYDIKKGLTRIVKEEKNLFSASSYRDYTGKFIDNDLQISELTNEKKELEKECNKILFHIEMSPKASNEYKEAVQKAEELLFKE